MKRVFPESGLILPMPSQAAADELREILKSEFGVELAEHQEMDAAVRIMHIYFLKKYAHQYLFVTQSELEARDHIHRVSQPRKPRRVASAKVRRARRMERARLANLASTEAANEEVEWLNGSEHL